NGGCWALSARQPSAMCPNVLPLAENEADVSADRDRRVERAGEIHLHSDHPLSRGPCPVGGGQSSREVMRISRPISASYLYTFLRVSGSPQTPVNKRQTRLLTLVLYQAPLAYRSVDKPSSPAWKPSITVQQEAARSRSAGPAHSSG